MVISVDQGGMILLPHHVNQGGPPSELIRLQLPVDLDHGQASNVGGRALSSVKMGICVDLQ